MVANVYETPCIKDSTMATGELLAAVVQAVLAIKGVKANDGNDKNHEHQTYQNISH